MLYEQFKPLPRKGKLNLEQFLITQLGVKSMEEVERQSIRINVSVEKETFNIEITGRKKDVIIKAGRNLYPAEIEQLTAEIEGVRKGSNTLCARPKHISNGNDECCRIDWPIRRPSNVAVRLPALATWPELAFM